MRPVTPIAPATTKKRPAPRNRKERRERGYMNPPRPGRLLALRRVTSRRPTGGSGPSQKAVERYRRAVDAVYRRAALQELTQRSQDLGLYQ